MGSKIDTNLRFQLDRYAISDLDESSEPKYYGFLSEDGTWYIMMNSSDHFRYLKGQKLAAYTSAWLTNSAQTYDYYSTVF